MMMGPEDPMTVTQEGAVHLHEIFLSFLAAGFDEGQATYLVGELLRTTVQMQVM